MQCNFKSQLQIFFKESDPNFLIHYINLTRNNDNSANDTSHYCIE